MLHKVENINLEASSQRILNGRETFSQAHQDLFALWANRFKQGGTYIEVGAGDPKESSNTFLLESRYGWSGLSFEIDEVLVEKFQLERPKNNCILGDVLELSLNEYLNDIESVDYLSLDIDPARNTLEALKILLDYGLSANAITFEHDRYLDGDGVMNESREILFANDYVLVVPNVICVGRDFEDWYVKRDTASLLLGDYKATSFPTCGDAIASLLQI